VAEEPGYFMNRKAAFESENTLNCLSADPPPSTSPPADPKIPVLLHYCDKPEGSRLNSNKIPYWVLRASTIAGHFNIVNFSGRCLEAEVGGTDAITRRCVASSANQAWRFEDLGLAGPAPTTGVPAPRIHRIRANAGGRCLGTLNGSTTSNSDVRMFTCDSSKEDQEWVFFH
jgi:hypothetical protein